MKKITCIFATIAFTTLLLAGCKKDKIEDKETGTLVIKIDNVVGNEDLVLNSTPSHQPYTNAMGQPFGVSTYKYYLSNVKLVNTDGSEYVVPESYYLVDESNPESLTLTIADVPKGSYNAIKLLHGVDEARNTSGAQTGALDVMNAMFWDWNTGYIMARLEGFSSSSPNNFIVFHLGGFRGVHSVLQNVTLTTPSNIEINSNKTSTVSAKADLLKWFGDPNPTDFSLLHVLMDESKESKEMSLNYAQMLQITDVQN